MRISALVIRIRSVDAVAWRDPQLLNSESQNGRRRVARFAVFVVMRAHVDQGMPMGVLEQMYPGVSPSGSEATEAAAGC